jgi:hypothetical protein
LRRIFFAAALLCAPILFLACQTSTSVRVSNPTDGALTVQVNERSPFELKPHATVSVHLPALERLQPVSITARDAHGAMVYSASLSYSAITAAGQQVVLAVDPARTYDPLLSR